MTEYSPIFKPGEAVTFVAAEAVVGGQLVEVAGDRKVKPATADSGKAIGVAGFNAAEGGNVVVFCGGVHRLAVSGSVVAGDTVAAAAEGKVAKGSGNVVGLVLAARESYAEVKLTV